MKLKRYTVFGLVCAALLAGCASAPATRFYTLTAPLAPLHPVKTTPIYLQMLPVHVPESLMRPQLVIRSQDGTQLSILEQARWPSPFNDELRDALTNGIVSKLGAIDVSRTGVPANQTEYRVAVVLQQLDALPGNKVVANASWIITRLDADPNAENNRTLSCQLTASKTVDSGIDGLVHGMQAAIAEISDIISNNINALQASKDATCKD